MMKQLGCVEKMHSLDTFTFAGQHHANNFLQ